MANELFTSALTDTMLAEVLSAEASEILTDRFSLWGHPAIHYAGNCAQKGATTFQVPLTGWNKMTAVAENASASNSLLPTDSVTVSVGRQVLQYEISDLADMVDAVGVNVPGLVAKMVTGAAMRWQEMLCAELDGFTATAGTAGGATAFSADAWFNARFALIQAGVPGPHLAVMAPEQITDLMSSLRSETGPVELREDVQDIFGAQGQGIVTRLTGVDVVSSSYVVTDTGDRKGAMFGQRAITYADGTPNAIRGAGEVVYPEGSRLYVGLERNESGALTKIVGNYFVGLAQLEDARGVTLVSAAA